MPSQSDVRLLRLRLAMSEYQKRVGARIRTERERRGWSQNELASRIPGKTDGAAVGRWERGGVFPRPGTLDAIAHALDVDPAELLAESREPGPVIPLDNVLAGRSDPWFEHVAGRSPLLVPRLLLR